jgi:hypothetical protein
MKTIKRILAPKEVKVALNVLDELSLELQMEAFETVHRQIENTMLGDCKKVVSKVKEGTSPRHLVYFAIANLAGDHLESGAYHIYRGVLNPLGLGCDFLRLFNMAIDRLLKEGAISEKEAKEQKAGIKESIKCVG